jgi:hypothetical protein
MFCRTANQLYLLGGAGCYGYPGGGEKDYFVATNLTVSGTNTFLYIVLVLRFDRIPIAVTRLRATRKFHQQVRR